MEASSLMLAFHDILKVQVIWPNTVRQSAKRLTFKLLSGFGAEPLTSKWSGVSKRLHFILKNTLSFITELHDKSLIFRDFQYCFR